MEDILEYFDSITEFAETIKKRPNNPEFKGMKGSESTKRTEWYGTRNMTEADYLLKCGDWDKLGAFKKVDGNSGFTNVSDKTTPKIRNCENGGTVNIARFLQGEPKCMRRIQRIHRRDNIVSIVYQCNMTCGYTSDEIESNGRKVAAIVKSLESSGYRVNLYVVSCSYESMQHKTTIVKLKDSGEPLNTLALTYPLCNTSMFRRHFFKSLETTPGKMESGWRYGYGFSETDSKVVREKIGTRIKGAFRLLTSYELINIHDEKDLFKYLNLQ